MRQRRRHGKPHQEQDRIGVAHGPVFGSSPGLVARGVRRRTSQRNGHPSAQAGDRTRLTGHLTLFDPGGLQRRGRPHRVLHRRIGPVAGRKRVRDGAGKTAPQRGNFGISTDVCTDVLAMFPFLPIVYCIVAQFRPQIGKKSRRFKVLQPNSIDGPVFPMVSQIVPSEGRGVPARAHSAIAA